MSVQAVKGVEIGAGILGRAGSSAAKCKTRVFRTSQGGWEIPMGKREDSGGRANAGWCLEGGNQKRRGTVVILSSGYLKADFDAGGRHGTADMVTKRSRCRRPMSVRLVRGGQPVEWRARRWWQLVLADGFSAKNLGEIRWRRCGGISRAMAKEIDEF